MQAAELRALAAEARVAQLEQALEASRTAAELAADAAARELEHLKMSFQRERDTLLCELGVRNVTHCNVASRQSTVVVVTPRSILRLIE